METKQNNSQIIRQTHAWIQDSYKVSTTPCLPQPHINKIRDPSQQQAARG
jgi:hypothetical protein